jgi:hypothetical protein
MQMPKPRPYLLAALLCESVIEEKSGTLTLVRILDRVEFERQVMPQGFHPVIPIKGLLSIRSGPLRGEFSLKMKVIRPNGEQKGQPIALPPIKLLGGDQGVNVNLNLMFGIEDEGLHWFEIYFEDELLTSIPITVVQKQTPSEQSRTATP